MPFHNLIESLSRMTRKLDDLYSMLVSYKSMTNNKEAMNLVFVNHHAEDAIYLLTTKEILESQNRDLDLKTKAEMEGYSKQLVKDTKKLCKDSKRAIPKDLQYRAVYHHNLQHVGIKYLEGTPCLSMY